MYLSVVGIWQNILGSLNEIGSARANPENEEKVRQDSSAGARKKDGFVRTNNQEEPPVIISCQSSSFLVQSRPWCTYVASPSKSVHVMHSTNDPLGEPKRVSRIKHPAQSRSRRRTPQELFLCNKRIDSARSGICEKSCFVGA